MEYRICLTGIDTTLEDVMDVVEVLLPTWRGQLSVLEGSIGFVDGLFKKLTEDDAFDRDFLYASGLPTHEAYKVQAAISDLSTLVDTLRIANGQLEKIDESSIWTAAIDEGMKILSSRAYPNSL